MIDHKAPHLCYCQIPEEKLKELARKRFEEGIPTEVLMKQITDPKEREYLAAIALLDVQVENLPKIVPQVDKALLMHLVDCRYHVRSVLEDDGLKIEEIR